MAITFFFFFFTDNNIYTRLITFFLRLSMLGLRQYTIMATMLFSNCIQAHPNGNHVHVAFSIYCFIIVMTQKLAVAMKGEKSQKKKEK